jgi:hypothetical protein
MLALATFGPRDGRAVHDRRLDRAVEGEARIGQGAGGGADGGDVVLDDLAVFLGDVQGRDRVRLVDDGGVATLDVGDDDADRAGRLGVGALVDQHVVATVADQDLAADLGRIQQRRHRIGGAEALGQAGVGRIDAGRPALRARISGADGVLALLDAPVTVAPLPSTTSARYLRSWVELRRPWSAMG